jgi:hypothetical protein
VTPGAKAAALGGVGPRHARRPEAADRWSPGVLFPVTRDRESAGHSYEAPVVPSRSRAGRESALAGGRGRTGGDPAETAAAGTDARDPAETAAAGMDARDPAETAAAGTDERDPAETAAAGSGTVARAGPEW